MKIYRVRLTHQSRTRAFYFAGEGNKNLAVLLKGVDFINDAMKLYFGSPIIDVDVAEGESDAGLQHDYSILDELKDQT